MLKKCYAYATMKRGTLPDEYRVIYKKVTQAIEEMECNENVRAVLRLRYCHGHRFVEISDLLDMSYQWVYELHKLGESLLKKHLSF